MQSMPKTRKAWTERFKELFSNGTNVTSSSRPKEVKKETPQEHNKRKLKELEGDNHSKTTNDVVNQLIGVQKPMKPPTIRVCPFCGHQYIWNGPETICPRKVCQGEMK